MTSLRDLACSPHRFSFLRSPARTRRCRPASRRSRRVEGITEYRLANGLTRAAVPRRGHADDHGQRHVPRRLAPRELRRDRHGAPPRAHGVQGHADGAATSGTEMTKRGMRNNGTTWFDRTNYFETFNASPANLEWALEMEADRMVNSLIDRKDLDTEMTVVRNEFERGENNPGAHPVAARCSRRRTAGTTTARRRSARAPTSRASTSTACARSTGRTTSPTTRCWSSRARSTPTRRSAGSRSTSARFPSPTRTLPRLYTQEPVQDGERMVTMRRVGDQQLVGIAYHTVPGAHPDYVAVDALGEHHDRRARRDACTRRSSRRRRRAASARAAPGLFDPGTSRSSRRCRCPIRSTRRAMPPSPRSKASRSEPITAGRGRPRPRARAKEVDETLTDPTRFGIRLSESIASGDWRLFFLTRDRYRTVTRADVQRVAARLPQACESHGGAVHSRREARSRARAAAVDVAALVKDYKGDPAAGAGEVFVATPANLDARTQRFTLANGMKVALLPKKTRGETGQARAADRPGRREVAVRHGTARLAHGGDAGARHARSARARRSRTRSTSCAPRCRSRRRSRTSAAGETVSRASSPTC